MQLEFGELWELLPRAAQIGLISGCVVYSNLYALGQSICDDIDFSAAIIPIVKACEIVFKKHLCLDYYDYVIRQNISPQMLDKDHPFTYYDKIERRVRFKEKEWVEFTLGSIKHIVLSKRQYDVAVCPVFLEYAQTAFEDGNTLERYFLQLARRMSQFTFDIRNPAAHSDIMPIWQAEICGNEIIKVRKILQGFISKIGAY